MLLVKHIRKFAFVLGRGCNNKCSHCMQKQILNSHSSDINNVLFKFLNDWAEYYISLSKKERFKPSFYFWGGEPLVYFELLTKIADMFWSRGIRRANYSLTTNGLALTQDMVDYFNEKDFHIMLSYDGPNEHSLRPLVMSDKQRELFLKINRRGVLWCWNKDNPDFIASYYYLKNKFPGTPLRPYALQINEGFDKDLAYLDKGVAYNSVKNAIMYMNDNNVFIPCLYKFFLGHIGSPDEFSMNDYMEIPVCSDPTILQIDMNGNILDCRNSDNVISKIMDDPVQIIYSLEHKWDKVEYPSGCKNCLYFLQCRRNCPLSKLTDDKKELLSCRYYKEIYQAVRDIPLKEGLFKVCESYIMS